jgi:hypothetical protein
MIFIAGLVLLLVGLALAWLFRLHPLNMDSPGHPPVTRIARRNLGVFLWPDFAEVVCTLVAMVGVVLMALSLVLSLYHHRPSWLL